MTYRIEGFFDGRPITIWEMRNPMIYTKYAEMMVDYNFSPVAIQRIQEINPKDKNNLFIHQVIKIWGPQLQAQISQMKQKLSQEGQTKNLQIVEMVHKTFLFEGYQQFFENLIPQNDSEENPFPLVLAHNDAQENNILMNHTDNRNLMLIDYEYTGWNPMAMDLADYFTETVLENAYPYGNGINWYLDNIMQQSELESMVKTYLAKYFENYMREGLRQKYQNSTKLFIEREYLNFEKQVWDCSLIHNFLWGVWALALLSVD